MIDLMSMLDTIAPAPARAAAPRPAPMVPAAKAAASLPAVRRTADLARQSDNLPQPVKSNDIPLRLRQVRDERWEFCRAVVQLAGTEGISHQDAVPLVAARDHDKYVHISGKTTYTNFCRWLRRIGSRRDASGRRVYNWDNRDALLDQYRTGARETDFAPVIYRIFLGMYLNPRKPTISCCYRETSALTARLFPELPMPTKSQLTYQLNREPPNLIAAGREGLDYCLNKSLYMLIRDWDRVRPMQCWIADSRPFDCLIRVPDESRRCKWRSTRPNITYITDAASWYCIAFEATADSVDSDVIRNTFARGVAEHGRPEVLYIDNGKDYNKAGFTHPVTIEGREFSIFGELGVRLTLAKPYRGRSKTVERNFRDYSMDFDRRQPSYLGDSPEHRPDGAALYDTDEGVMLLPTLGQFCQLLKREVDKFNAAPRGGRFRGRTPEQIFGSSARIERAPMSQEELTRAMLLPLPKSRTVARGGCIKVGNVQFFAPELFDHTGSKIVVKTSYLTPGHVYAYNLDGSYICECRCQDAVHPLATIYGDDDDKRLLDEQLCIQAAQRRDLERSFAAATGGMSGLAIEEIKTLNRDAIESGSAAVTIITRNKVQGGSHRVKLVSTAAGAAVAARELQTYLDDAMIDYKPATRKEIAPDDPEIAEIGRIIASPDTPQDSHDADELDVEEIHNLLTQPTRGDDDDEY